jgi:selenide,water dikinase
VLKSLGDVPDEGISATLVTPQPAQVYSGMVPGYVAGHYTLEECSIALAPLASRAHASVHFTTGALVNPTMREVILANGEVVPYDVLSVDVGSQPLVAGAKGVREHAIAIRPLEKFVDGWERVLARAREGRIRSVSVVGGGAAGVEVALAIDYRFRSELGGVAPHVRILTNTDVPLPDFPDGMRRRLARILQRRNVGAHVACAVSEVGRDFLRLEGGNEFASDATFWVAGAAAPDWIRDSGLRTDARGFLAVNDFLQSLSHPEVFGSGDCATNIAHPRAKSGVFAVRAGPALAVNLRAAIRGEPLAPHLTRERFLVLLSAGKRYAVGVYGPFSWEGRWVWHLKDRIDRRFIARYAQLPATA